MRSMQMVSRMKQVEAGAGLNDAVKALRGGERFFDSGVSGLQDEVRRIALGRRPIMHEILME
jgi:hypothetical protein